MAIRSLGRPKTGGRVNIMKIYDWQDCIQDRYKWKEIVEKVKTFKVEVVEPKEEEAHMTQCRVVG
jgi:hypothetical protein